MNDGSSKKWRGILSRPLDTRRVASAPVSPQIEIGAASVCGALHAHNTDHYLAIRIGRVQETLLTSLASADVPPRFEEHGYAMLVADGLGGDGGARASRAALSTLAHVAILYGKWNVRVNPDSARDIFAQCEFLYGQAHDAVRQESRTDAWLANMATSLTALYIAEDNLFFAHVGHSGAFLLRDGDLVQLTGDSVISTVGGRAAPPRVATEQVKLLSGDRLLLCTNGLTDVLEHERIADALAARRSPQQDCKRLIDLARVSASADDVTVIIADYTIRQNSAHAEPATDTAGA